MLKIVGVNAAGLMSKIESFEKLLSDLEPAVFCVQETKIRKPNMIKCESSKRFTIYELHRKNSSGGGLCIGVLKDLHPVWIAQGDDEVECLAVEIWVDNIPVRIVTGYGPQVGDAPDRKVKFWDFIEREAKNAKNVGAAFILQMDSNAHLGNDILINDPNVQNVNGKLFCEFLKRLPHLTVINSLPLCEGSITRMRKTINGVEKSILDVFVTCDKMLPYIKRMTVDDSRKHALTNFKAFKESKRVIESDHNVEVLEIDLVFSNIKPERIQIYQFKNAASQVEFKKFTTNTTAFTDCFETNESFEEQALEWRKVLNDFFRKSFKKIRINNKPRKAQSKLNDLMERRNKLKKKQKLDEKEDDEICVIENQIAEECEEVNRRKVTENFKAFDCSNVNVNQHGVWKIKKKYFPKKKQTLPVGKKNLKKQLITNPNELKSLYLNTFKHRLRKRPTQPGYESLLDLQEELFNLRLNVSKLNKSCPWTMTNLELALKSLKNGKCRDPEGLIREIFKEEVIGDNLKKSMLILYNKIKVTGSIPEFMKNANIHAIYKGKGDVTDLDSDRGIFILSIFRTILMKLIYKDKYDIIERSMSDSNIGARKMKNIRNHIFVVNSIIHDVLSKKSKQPIDIMILDYKQMFDSECLFECLNDVFEAGVVDDNLALIYEANKESFVAVQTPNGLSSREVFEEIVMQGDVLAPLISSLQVDTMGKECLLNEKHLYFYKDLVPIPPLGLVDDLFTISTCGFKTTMMNQFINSKTGMKKLQFGTTKCKKLHVGRSSNATICKDLYVGGWEVEVVTDTVTGECSQEELFVGDKKMKVEQEQVYLGDVISADGKHSKNVMARKGKGLGIINEIMNILETIFFGKYYFEVALILRSSLLLSSILLNSEAWVNLSEKDIKILEQTDEILLNKILECDSNTSNVFKYLELGIYPVRFEIMKRKIVFLQYILKQKKDSMIFQVFKATCDSPIKNDFMEVCNKYLKILDINLSLEEIENLSSWRFKRLVKTKTNVAAYKYLIEEKNKQSKICNIQFRDLKIKDYLFEGNVNTKVSKFVFKARSKNLDIKLFKKWKYTDKLCTGCGENEESESELITCKGFGENEKFTYDMLYSDSTQEIVLVAKYLMKRLKVRQKLIEEIT